MEIELENRRIPVVKDTDLLGNKQFFIGENVSLMLVGPWTASLITDKVGKTQELELLLMFW